MNLKKLFKLDNEREVESAGFIGLFHLIVYWYLKTFISMSAKIDLRHLDYYCNTDYIKAVRQVGTKFCPDLIMINGYDSDIEENFVVYLDKSTAIKFAKTLRTEINKIKE